jgi:hypothetical protein
MVYSTDYQSPYPSGFMTPNIQAERRTDSPATVASARAYNRHDVEILRMQEVLGQMPTAPSGVPNPSGSVFSILYNIYHSGSPGSGIPAGNLVPFHDTPADPNYQFVEWLLDWMGIWGDLSATGTPSITEVVKALWNNKYDLEVLFDPKFLYPAERWWVGDIDPNQQYFKYVTTGTEGPINFGGLYDDPKKPIGGGCNLSYRPWPVYDVYCETCAAFLEGIVNHPAGHTLRFYVYPTQGDSTLGVGNAKLDEDHLVGLFGNSPFQYYSQPSGYIPNVATIYQPVTPTPTGIIPPPPPWPPWTGIPMPDGYPYPPYGAVVEASKIIIDPSLDAFVDGAGRLGLAAINMQTTKPVAADGNPAAIAMIPGSGIYAVNLSISAAQVCIPLIPGWNFIFAAVTPGALGGPVASADWHCRVDLLPFGDFVTPSVWPPVELDFDLPIVILVGGQLRLVPIGYTYADTDSTGMALITLSEEGMPIDPMYVVAIGTRSYPLVLSGMQD